MENIEIKANYPDLRKAEKICKEIGCSFEGTLLQTDTYFHSPTGRLKLREIEDRVSQLIFYERPDQTAPKISKYEICSVENPQKLKEILRLSLGVWKVVKKQRLLFLFDEVRIHLDTVEQLGCFVELEGVVTDATFEIQTQKKVAWLSKALGITGESLIPSSYSDLLQ